MPSFLRRTQRRIRPSLSHTRWPSHSHGSCRTCLLLVFAEWMDCTCPEAFRITFFQAPEHPRCASAAFCLISGSVSSWITILRSASVPPFSCCSPISFTRTHAPLHMPLPHLFLRLKSKRFYIVIVIIATRAHTHTHTLTHPHTHTWSLFVHAFIFVDGVFLFIYVFICNVENNR